jgi:hypothetical protein
MWGCMDTRSQSVSPLLQFYRSTNLQQPLQLSAPPKTKNHKEKNEFVFCYCRDSDLTLLPSLGEVGECHELLK